MLVDILTSVFRDGYRVGAVMLALVLLEVIFPTRRLSFTSRFRGFTFWVLTIITTAVVMDLWWRLVNPLQIKPLITLDMTVLPAVLSIYLGAVIGDFFFYWMHRFQHRFLWRWHAVHHSITEMSALSSYHHLSEVLVKIAFMVIPGMLLGVQADQVAYVGTLFALQGIYLHSSTRLHIGPLRYVVGDNRFHRIHHSTDPGHHGKNFSGFWPIWDVVFGTAYFPKKGEWPEVGLSDRPEPVSGLQYLWPPTSPVQRPAR